MNGVVTVVSCSTNGVHDIRGTLLTLKRSIAIATSESRVLRTSGIVLPNINTFKSTVRGLGRSKLSRMVHRIARGKAPFLKVYLKLRLLFRRDSRTPNMRKLKVLGNRVLEVPSGRKCGVPRVK